MDGSKTPAPVSQPAKNRVVKTNRTTVAARWNIKVLRGLEVSLRKDPEANLSDLLSSTYPEQLKSFKELDIRPSKGPRPLPSHDIRSRLHGGDPTTIVRELSPELLALLGDFEHLSEAVIDLLDESEVLYKSAWAASCMVFRISDTITAKVTIEKHITTEYCTLPYLQEHLPQFPAPRLHGVVQIGRYGLLFTSFIPGLDLEKVWPQLNDPEKRAISAQLDKLLNELRTLPYPPNTLLGGIQGQGCKDGRRAVRVNSEPILDAKEFEDFIFAGSKTASPMYTQFLRTLMPASPAKVVFTHGDIRPANIMVRQDERGPWSVVAIIDWESSGFYPEYWESVKMTNNLTPRDRDDWYLLLPESLSAKQYPVQWLVDRIWDRNLENS
ncbi:kinase-like domain-containing protein [Chaetomidium leptoderma]|uniref:Kinase-like domain-containing protein n=1 Tax=Chaetomidium leptoderma TaxID=669021 RepID=A0AAN6VII8_9PEZI|nr:kinase-like domain-containing protein [Chaetomidium leptoderma]